MDLVQDKKKDPHNYMADLIGRVNSDTEARLLGSLESVSPEHAAMVRKHMFTFADLVKISTASIQALLQECDKSRLAMALKLSDDSQRQKFLSNMSERQAKMFRDELESGGTPRKPEVEEAQKEIVLLAKALSAAGLLSLEPEEVPAEADRTAAERSPDPPRPPRPSPCLTEPPVGPPAGWAMACSPRRPSRAPGPAPAPPRGRGRPCDNLGRVVRRVAEGRHDDRAVGDVEVDVGERQSWPASPSGRAGWAAPPPRARGREHRWPRAAAPGSPARGVLASEGSGSPAPGRPRRDEAGEVVDVAAGVVVVEPALSHSTLRTPSTAEQPLGLASRRAGLRLGSSTTRGGQHGPLAVDVHGAALEDEGRGEARLAPSVEDAPRHAASRSYSS